MSKQQKQMAAAAVALLALYLLYRHIQGQNAGTVQSAGTASPDSAATDFAALAGQEQGDVANLQSQNQQLLAQEQGDVAALQGQEGGDVSSIMSALTGFTTTIDAATSRVNVLNSDVAAIASGQQKINRQLNQTLVVHQGRPFSKYYKKVTGKNAPTRIAVTNFIYQAFKAGIPASAIAKKQHPASNNTHVAHPNPSHKPQTKYSGGAGIANNKTKTPPKPSKAKASGARR